jgi:hypothetical protein
MSLKTILSRALGVVRQIGTLSTLAL